MRNGVLDSVVRSAGERNGQAVGRTAGELAEEVRKYNSGFFLI